MKNLKLKAKAAVLAGVTLVTSTGLSACGKEEKLENHNNPALSPVSASDSSQVDAVTTDVTTDENGNAYVTDADGETSYVETSYTTYTTDDQGNAYVTDLDGETSYVETTVTTDSYIDYGSKTSSVNRVTTAKSISGNGDVTTKKTTDNETTKKGSTTNTTATTKKPTTTKTTTTTKKTTPTTTKKTTTTTKITTTTTKATTVTQPPVQNYTIDDICYNAAAFRVFSDYLSKDLKKNYSSNSLIGFDFGYGVTYLGCETNIFLETLNGNCNNAVINRNCYGGISQQMIVDSKMFLLNFKLIEDTLGCDIDYSKYTIDPEIGNFLNMADDAYRNGSFDKFMNDYIVNGNISQKCLNNPGLMAILYSYDDYGLYLDYESIDNSLNDVINCISMDAYGYGYSK